MASKQSARPSINLSLCLQGCRFPTVAERRAGISRRRAYRIEIQILTTSNREAKGGEGELAIIASASSLPVQAPIPVTLGVVDPVLADLDVQKQMHTAVEQAL